uniref:Uncharacterized protein n=1 Tax=Kwoniella bestiolae CBS 10118 TaxID=1296100 RepID=A0A1B9FTA3_9TREE|nr:hypothetical protein I302_08780 [Kwoniella bestiolae CBS 10118]OCF21999.1 hypothetical protein I302_08780 [Kwoniella bestiolae CBS 10118]
MQIQSLYALLPLLVGLMGQTGAVPIYTLIKREVPQEKSHASVLTAVQTVLQQDNPLGIVDPVFGLLGNAAAAAGAGQVINTDCLQQATADQAFTNAKAANDVAGMTAALTYRALERNTGQVGLASVLCTETPVNPEIAAITQHQDPASADAAATNKAITLALAQQIAAVGGDPMDALKSGTFAPGDVNDPTGKGNSCDEDDCIFTQNLLVEDATEEEINAAVAGIASTGAGASTDTAAGADTTDSGATSAGCPAVVDDSTSGNSTSTDTATGDGTAADTSDSTGASTNTNPAAGIDVGQCTDFSITFAGGLDNRAVDEFTFQPTDLTNFNHGSALNPSIITQFMCDTFVNACANSATTRDVCKTVAADLDAQLASGALQRDQGFADAWLDGLESAFGISSTGTGSAGGATGGTGAVDTATDDTATDTDDSTSTGGADSANAAAGTDATGATGTGNNAAATGVDVGQCTDFSLTFAGGLDNRAADEFTFQPVSLRSIALVKFVPEQSNSFGCIVWQTDLTNFNHGSALNPSIITQFMCDTFVNACANSATTRDVCKTVAADLDAQLASGALARDQGFADAWLTGLEAAFGIQSTGTGTGNGAAAAATGAADDTTDDTTDDAEDGTGATANTATATASADTGAETAAAAGDAASAATATSVADDTTAASGDNLQTFSEALNGVAATPVINIGDDRPFQVKTDTFVNSGAAFQRSCDQQFNGCANAANSGSGDASVAECSAQKERCSAAIPQA